MSGHVLLGVSTVEKSRGPRRRGGKPVNVSLKQRNTGDIELLRSLHTSDLTYI